LLKTSLLACHIKPGIAGSEFQCQQTYCMLIASKMHRYGRDSTNLQQLSPQLLPAKLLGHIPVHLEAAGVEVNVSIPGLT
jgi:hypothetical protein